MIIDTIRMGCEHTVHVNDLRLCEDCYAKLDHDLIRAKRLE